MRVGIDIEEIERFNKFNQEKFCEKYLTTYEKEYVIKKGIQSLAGIYSCKEAILKCIGIGIGNGVLLKDISIKHTEKGKPYVEENETLQKLKQEYNFTQIDISISHTSKIVESICIIV